MPFMVFRSLLQKNGTYISPLIRGKNKSLIVSGHLWLRCILSSSWATSKQKKQFFIFDLRSAADDVAYILRKHLPDAASLSDIAISKPTRLAQQAEILQLMNYQLCSPEWKRKLQEKACQLAVVYTKPVYIFK